MIIHEYGDSTLPKVLVLHPMLADAACVQNITKSMNGNYCFIIPDFSAHGNDTEVYQSAKKEADRLLDFLKEKGYTDIALLMGASMGGMIGMYLVGDRELRIQTMVFEGTPSFTGSWFVCKIMQSIFLKKHRRAKKLSLEKVEEIQSKMYGKTFGTAMARNFRKIDEDSIKAIIYDCGHAYFPQVSEKMQKRMFWAVGDKDMNYRRLNGVRKQYPSMNIIVQKGYGHCMYLAEHYHEYGDLLEKYMQHT